VLRRIIQIPVAIVLLVGGFFLATAIHDEENQPDNSGDIAAPLAEVHFTVWSGAGRLLIEGNTYSSSHEQALLELASDQFPEAEVRTAFTPGVLLSSDWESASTRLLYAVAATESAQALMRPRTIDIRGVTVDAKSFESRLAFLRDTAAAHTTINSNVITVNPGVSFSELCTQAFSTLVIEPVSFKQSSVEIRTSSYVSLDRIADFAADCQHATIVITGHTDDTGDADWNQQLSVARAQAVADHVAGRGVAAERLVVQGRGATEPIADNTTVQGRGLNRRIEFELR